MSDWENRLRDVADSVRAEPGAVAGLEARVARLRRRRAAAVTVLSVGVVVGTIAVAALLGRSTTPVASAPDASPPTATAPTPSVTQPPLVGDLWEEPEPGECPRYNKVFDPAAAPPIRDLDEQQQTVADITALVRNAFTVRYARPTPLGVVALVRGNLDVAKEQLREYGVTLVYEWDASGPDVGLDPEGQVRQVIDWQLQPVVHDVQRSVRGIDGNAGLALWVNAGAILVQWKKPVPAEILALVDTRYKSGVRVYVDGVPYSSKELLDAGRLVIDRMSGTDVEVSMAARCGDSSGLVVGVVPSSLRGREAELKQRFEDLTGYPVTVVPEGKAVDLVGSARP